MRKKKKKRQQRETDLWIKLRPLVPITTAAGFNLSASLHIALPASPSTILAFDFTYFCEIFTHDWLRDNKCDLLFLFS